MRILIVTNMYAGSNPSHPHQGIFVTEQVDALRALHGDALDVVVIEGHRSRFEYLKSLCFVPRLVTRHAYDIVHYHFGLSACSAPLVRIFTRARIVITFHGSDVLGNRWVRAISLAAARFAHACIGVSDEIRARLQSVAKDCITIPCAVDETLFSPSAQLRPTANRSRIVVFPSSPLRAEKDYALFNAAFVQLSRTWQLDVIERHIDALDRHEVRDLLANADCLIMTSRREGSPQSVKEAMAVNLPVVSVDVGDVRHLLHRVSRSKVVDGRDAQTLARAVAEILTDGKRSDGRRRLQALGYFSADVAKQIDRLYARLLGKPPGNRPLPSRRAVSQPVIGKAPHEPH